MTTPIKYIWDKNNLNTAPLSADLQDNGYANAAIPGSAEFNELWRNVSLLTAESYSTGDFRSTFNEHPPWQNSGWLYLEDGTIGSALSGATLRANNDTENLYVMFWDFLDSICPVIGGRGVSAIADFTSNKPITLPLTTGRVFCNARASALYLKGQSFGINSVSLTKENLAKHTHNVIQQGGRATLDSYQNGSNQPFRGEVNTLLTTTDGAEDGLDGALHENRQPSVACYFFIKL